MTYEILRTKGWKDEQERRDYFDSVDQYTTHLLKVGEQSRNGKNNMSRLAVIASKSSQGPLKSID